MYNVDYSVLVFYAAMFVFTSALWSSGLIPEIMSNIPNIPNTVRLFINLGIKTVLDNALLYAITNQTWFDLFIGFEDYLQLFALR